MAFPTIAVGGTTTFTVVPMNAEGVVVPDTGITVTSDTPAVATATCNPDGSNGIVTGVSLGSYNITATDTSGITSAPVNGVVADTKVATLTVTPS